MSNHLEKSAVILIFGIVPLLCFSQQPGELDLSFGTNGFLVFGETSTRNDETRSLLVRSDGKILVVGKVAGFSGQDNDILLAQVTSDGVIDNSFGQNGVIVKDLGGTSDIGQDILVAEDNTIMVAAGSNQSGIFESALLRYDQSGMLDSDFGVDGVAYLNIPGSASGLVSLASDENGKFYGGGSIDSDIYVAKFNSDGSFDNGFSNNGVQQADLSQVDGVAGRLKLLGNGQLMGITNGSEVGESLDSFIWRMNDDGSWDQSFNGSGWINLSLSDGADAVYDFEVMEDGRVLVIATAYSTIEMVFEIVALRLTSDGSFDNTFGTTGMIRFDIGSGNSYAFSLVVQPDGKFIIGGSANDGNDDNFCLTRLNEDGSLDPTFGNNGIVITEVSEGFDAIADMELQSDGKLIVGGTANINGNDDIVVARYHTGLSISVDEIDEKPLFSVYPNPTTNSITIKAEEKLEDVELLDALGRTVLSQRISALRTQLDISHLPSGIYLLQTSDGKTLFSQRIIKE